MRCVPFGTAADKDGKRFKCSACAYRSCRKGDVNKHTRKHSNVRPYRCRVPNVNCNATFKDPATRTRHEKVHYKNKLYNCELCKATFVQEGMLTRHKAEVHSKSIDLQPQELLSLGDDIESIFEQPEFM